MDFVDPDDSDPEYEPDSEEDEDDVDGRSGGTASWDSLDTTLCRLAQQVHSVESKLTLQLNIRHIGPKPFRVDHLLPNFLGYGGLVDINCEGECPAHCSPSSLTRTRNLRFDLTGATDVP